MTDDIHVVQPDDVILGIYDKIYVEGAKELHDLIELEMDAGYWLWDGKKKKKAREKIVQILNRRGRRFFDSVEGGPPVEVDGKLVERRIFGWMRTLSSKKSKCMDVFMGDVMSKLKEVSIDVTKADGKSFVQSVAGGVLVFESDGK